MEKQYTVLAIELAAETILAPIFRSLTGVTERTSILMNVVTAPFKPKDFLEEYVDVGHPVKERGILLLKRRSVKWQRNISTQETH